MQTSDQPVTPAIRFDDGAAYERYMGRWSQRAGDAFLDWVAPQPGLRWLDVGCGNGAFTERIIARCAPAVMEGVDPSAGQLAFARQRFAPEVAHFREGDAMALPFADDTFDVAVMPLVIFFVPDPATGVAEMRRVVRPGGTVAAYSWDMEGGGFPFALLQAEMRAIGVAPLEAPHPDASRLDVLTRLWRAAGLDGVVTRAITVQRTFVDFEDYWATIHGGPSVARALTDMTSAQRDQLATRLRESLPTTPTGSIACEARANAVLGRVPAVRSAA
jgi:SAM-dependent methyltransferase